MAQSTIANAYAKLLEHCEREADRLPAYLLQQSRDWAGGLYRAYEALLDNIPVQMQGMRVVDFGCKYGHLAPLLLARGCAEVIGVDAEDEYVSCGNEMFARLYDNVRLVHSLEGYIPIQPESADVVIMNEVISHVNPTFLDTVWREVGRVLVTGGVLFISDGNNSANPGVQRALPELYERWENGPDGAKTDRDVVTTSFINRRKSVIRERHPQLSAEEVDFVSANTSGLFGAALARNVDEYARTKQLICRPYRHGICPASPHESGVVMERGFHPVQLELALAEYGFDARQMRPTPSLGGAGLRGLVRDLRERARHMARRALDRDWYRSFSEGFQIVATKVR